MSINPAAYSTQQCARLGGGSGVRAGGEEAARRATVRAAWCGGRYGVWRRNVACARCGAARGSRQWCARQREKRTAVSATTHRRQCETSVQMSPCGKCLCLGWCKENAGQRSSSVRITMFETTTKEYVPRHPNGSPPNAMPGETKLRSEGVVNVQCIPSSVWNNEEPRWNGRFKRSCASRSSHGKRERPVITQCVVCPARRVGGCRGKQWWHPV